MKATDETDPSTADETETEAGACPWPAPVMPMVHRDCSLRDWVVRHGAYHAPDATYDDWRDVNPGALRIADRLWLPDVPSVRDAELRRVNWLIQRCNRIAQGDEPPLTIADFRPDDGGETNVSATVYHWRAGWRWNATKRALSWCSSGPLRRRLLAYKATL